MKSLSYLMALLTVILFSCNRKMQFDASGNFEADEVIVSAEQNGRLISFPIREGDSLNQGEIVGQIDVNNLLLQKQQNQASIKALQERTSDPMPQVEFVKRQLAVQHSQLENLQRERVRTENLVKADAATSKQLDDMDAQIDQLQKQILATQQQIKLDHSNIATQNRSVMSEKGALEKGTAVLQDQINRGKIANPIKGVVLTRYALEGELATNGRALYKIANIDTLTLRAYVTGDQLSQIRLGQQVRVFTDNGAKSYREYQGTIYWISDKSEFTPKTIQTRNERANLVYAIRIRVKNDGLLKLGMYAEVKFKE
ncbi:MAG: HlyD family secretion protein [Bacteroidetes bacterium]|nr:MAG: HlyD family secretion protein [Bacteroidota bacterium]